MPTYLRMWYLQKLAETRKKENDAANKNNKKTPTIHQPTFEKPKR